MPREYARYCLRAAADEPDPVQRLGHALAGLAAGDRPVGRVQPQQVVAPGQVRMEGRPLDERADLRQHPRRRPAGMGTPSSECVPSDGAISPSSIRMVVVLPEPFGPRNPKTAPGGHVQVDVVDRDVPTGEPLGEPLARDHAAPLTCRRR